MSRRTILFFQSITMLLLLVCSGGCSNASSTSSSSRDERSTGSQRTSATAQFSISTANSIPPSQVFKEINYGVGPGGGDGGVVCEFIIADKPTESEQHLGARLYVSATNLYLVGFRSNENVRLFAYKGSGIIAALAGWEEFQVDSDGQLTIQVPDSYSFVVEGDFSGVIYPHYKGGGCSLPYSLNVE